MIKSIKFRLYPNLKQQEQLDKMFGYARYIYNSSLSFSTEHYRDNKVSTNATDWNILLTAWKQENKWLRGISSVALQQEQRHLYSAFSRFFNKLGGYPNFKSKYDKQSFSLLKHFTIENGFLSIPKLKNIPITISKHIENMQSITISKTKTNKYYASISYETKLEAPSKPALDKSTALGLDVGIKDYLIVSDGLRIANPKFLEKQESILNRKHRQLSRKIKGSKNRAKARLKLANQYEKVSNLRSDFLHKLTTNLICKSQDIGTLCVESLNVSGMIRNHKLAKSIQSASWGEFGRQLNYKTEWYGMNLLQCGRFDPTSKTCNNCGCLYSALTLSERFWTCAACGCTLDRDLNAAKNIVDFAFNKLKDTAGLRESSELAQRKSVESKTTGRSQYLLPTKSMLSLKEAEIYCVQS